MPNRTIAGEYTDRFNKFGSGEENIHQTRALCHIADMLTAIAYDLRAIRENADRKEETE